ncbi:hypothetical protein F9C07_2101438 [Aspergillus flavus]|uniref:Uncharacterized protein n=1 Tax=Aspergillus flavus (strain ATCC 200026 / FGSC A1120 / IAM 13836 / NRRL 3357 / JCM 12722 / SRRC 167) TaxID=332952 RepID=A0A7G5JS69_ASPFN|nr:uncharacterized protein G4B84_001627 [Aspergillus flavus NRRL3357]QMW26382.1 hypothetical protein G4B84_001627 [Aspergillus flavus NRRL3357]QMW38461.1 hypothetical protein G4B11_001697 [Aspergillus flavus]QRD87518.1 hypothetical protein F9C07_2101438 [Aspergillus flavus]RAQ76676.1 hypothetical protein COH20_010817 [Aspergillus flavus]
MADAVHQDGLTSYCDLRILANGLEVYCNAKSFDMARQDTQAYIPHLASQHLVYVGNELARLREMLNLSPRCISAIRVPTASVWPHTPVRRVVEYSGTDFAVVQTTRGDIKAAHIVHTTKAWLGYLVPGLRPHISPVRGNAVHSAALAETSPSTCNLQRGCRAPPLPGGTAADYITHAPSGLPFVGQLPGRKHQWVSGGYHTMVKTILTIQDTIWEYPGSSVLAEVRLRALRQSLDLGQAAVSVPRL